MADGSPESSGAGLVDADAAVGFAQTLLPGAPTSVTGEPGDGQVAVSWVPGNAGPSPITEYRVQAFSGTDLAAATWCAPDVADCTLSGLTNGTGYTVTVTAFNGAGPSPASAPSALVTPLAPVTPVTPVTPQKPQQAVKCGGWPRRIKPNGVTTVLRHRCRTTAGARVRVTVTGLSPGNADKVRFRVSHGRRGKVRVRTFGHRMRLVLVRSAAAKPGYGPYESTRTYRLRRPGPGSGSRNGR